jgi:hypothetical protein
MSGMSVFARNVDIHGYGLAKRRANDFAAETLILRKLDKQIQCFRFKAEITQLVDKLGLSPGVVAGRFQYSTKK